MSGDSSNSRKSDGREGERERFARDVAAKERRKLRARRTEDRDVMFWIGMFGLVGWSVALPTLIGTAVGIWLDRVLDDRVSWTLTLLLVGLGTGCLVAWYWVRRESRGD